MADEIKITADSSKSINISDIHDFGQGEPLRVMLVDVPDGVGGITKRFAVYVLEDIIEPESPNSMVPRVVGHTLVPAVVKNESGETPAFLSDLLL